MTSAVQADSVHIASPSGSAVWLAALTAFVLWGGLAAGGVWVLLQAWPQLPRASQASAGVLRQQVNVADVRRVLQAPSGPLATKSSPAAVFAPAATIKVLGVVASASGQGAALLQVGKEPPKPYAPGSEVPGLGVVQSVTPQAIRMGARLDGPVTMTLVPPKSNPPQQ